jgi:hypothetical protein
MAQKQMTIETLAAMINEGCKTTATKEDIKALEERVNTRFDGIESRLGRIETLLLEEQRRKIENLETRMKKLEDALAISPHSKGRRTIAERFSPSPLSSHLTRAWGFLRTTPHWPPLPWIASRESDRGCASRVTIWWEDPLAAALHAGIGRYGHPWIPFLASSTPQAGDAPDARGARPDGRTRGPAHPRYEPTYTNV